MARSPDIVGGSLDDIRARLQRPEGVRRLGQALWMMVATPVRPNELIWARAVLGDGGDDVLWRALLASGVVNGPDFVVRPQQLAKFLGLISEDEHGAVDAGDLVWTLPPQLTVDGVAANGYVRSAIELIQSGSRTVTVVAPYLEPRGMGWLQNCLVEALARGLAVTVVTHSADDVSSLTSASLEELRRECLGMRGVLKVFTAAATVGVLLHPKIVLVDDCRGLVGSANVTSKGFEGNLETGVVVGGSAALEIARVVEALITAGLVALVYSTPHPD